MKPKYDYKRRKSGYTRSQMANELNIPYNKYVEIERGDRQMPSRLIDKFNEVINRGKHINKLESLNKEQEVNRWIDEMRQLTSDSKTSYALKDVMKDFNINSYKELCELLDIDCGTVHNILAGRAKSKDICNRLYDFFHDELNKQPIAKTKPITKTKLTREKNISPARQIELEWWNNFDLNDYLNKHNMNQQEFSMETGISRAQMSRLVSTDHTPKAPWSTTIARLRKYVESHEKTQDLKDEMPELPSENKQEEIVVEKQHTNSNNIAINTIENMIRDYDKKISDEMIYIERMNAEIDKMKLIVNTHNLAINDARSKKESLQEVLSVISNEMKGRN